MTAYRLYLVDPQETVAGSREAEFVSDLEAMAEAGLLSGDAYAVEVWRDEHLVARLGGEFQISGRI